MDYIPLDESLINSDVCIRCGHCCKWTTPTAFGNDSRIEWMEAIVSDNPHVEIVPHNKIDDGRYPYELKVTCSQLDTSDGFFKCKMYKNRPKACSEYNCFAWSNKLKRRPEAFHKQQKAIKEVHGIDVEYQNEMKPDPYIDRIKAKII